MGILLVLLLCLIIPICYAQHQHQTSSFSSRRTVIDVKHGPDSVVWAVQLSDLHFSVHHPQRAIDFRNLVPPALSMINPSLVLITGDLTGLDFISSLMRFSCLSVSFMRNHDPEFWACVDFF
ncbi:hypothetical protein GOBAR_DD07060 [Gossypium barbadense]|nr:hypothetical protein GOBAR_DD07060 [Gossypium barbadense]